MLFNPLEQFEVVIYFNFSFLSLDFSLTNAGFYMLSVSAVASALFFLSFFYGYVVSDS